MNRPTTSTSTLQFALALLASLALFGCGGCANSKPTSPPVVTQVSPGQTDGDSDFGAQVVVDSITAKAKVVSVDAQKREVVLQRADGRLAHCQARPGIVSLDAIKAGDEVTIAVGEERELALGQTALPQSAVTNSSRLHVKVPATMVGLAEASETLAFTGKIVSIDNFDRLVLLDLAEGRKVVHPSEAVDLSDFKPGDAVSVRITELVVLVVQRPAAQ